MSNTLIKDVFEEMCSNVHFDSRLFKTVCDMETRFVNKKREHIEFFGGSLTGVQTVRFTQMERDKLFQDVLNVSDDVLQTRLYALEDPTSKPGKKVPLINPEWNVVSDVFNISIIWVIHKFHHTKLLDPARRQEAKVRACQFLLYKYLTGLLYRYFKFPAEPDVARATYEQLSFKFRLKEVGSWGAALREMAENFVAEDSPFSFAIDTMNDAAVIRMIGDTQGRIRDMLKNIYDTFAKVIAKGYRVSSTSSFIESDGEMVLKDNIKNPGVYARYIKTIITDKNSFIKQELVDLICNVMHTTSPRLLMQTLNWTSDNFIQVQDGSIDDAVDIVMEHAIEYVQMNRTTLNQDLPTMIDRLRGAYTSSRSTDANLMRARNQVEKIVKEATGSRNETGVSAVRTAWMLYIVVRAFSRRYYTAR